MIEIYDKEFNYLISVSNNIQVSEFMFEHEMDYKYLLIKENGLTKIFDLQDALHIEEKIYCSRYSEFFQMAKVCKLANVDYYSFKRWKNGGQQLNKAEIRSLILTMNQIGNFNLDTIKNEVDQLWEKTLNE